MEPIYTIPYSEFAVARHLEVALKSSECTVTFPASRQNKGWDMLVFSAKSGRAARMQVKGSRGYPAGTPRGVPDGVPTFNETLWFNRFDATDTKADFYVLVGLYERSSGSARRSQYEAYRRLYLLFTAAEMRRFQTTVGHSFYLHFDHSEPQCIVRGRGAAQPFSECYEEFLLDRRIDEVRSFLRGEHIRVVGQAHILPATHNTSAA